MLDDIKDIGFKYATVSGTTIAIKDIVTPPQKQSLLSSADQKIRKLDEQYMEGMITQAERYQSSINVWEDVSKKWNLLFQILFQIMLVYTQWLTQELKET